jgi:hypothetical protein
MARITLDHKEFNQLDDLHDGLRRDYSGRGMYGDTCLGYVGSELHLFMHDLAVLLVERDSGKHTGTAYSDPTADEIRYELENTIGSPSTDSMGYDTIYYLPSVAVEPLGDDEDDEDDEDDDEE